MCNDDCRTVVGYFLQSFLDDTLTCYVEGAGGFVKDENSGVLDDASRDCYSLALTTAQFDAVISYLGVVALVILVWAVNRSKVYSRQGAQ